MCRFALECKKPAVTIVQHAKIPLCKEHFLKNIESRVKKTIITHHLIENKENEKILVALSGGKDSQTLLTILHNIFNNQIPLEALFIQLGITPRCYSQESERYAQKLCEQLNIPFHVLNIKEEYGFDMDEIHQLRKEFYPHHRSNGNHFRGECSYCGLIKRYAINKYAAMHNFTKVATGHNLTDEATQLISNFFNADVELMSRSGPITITEADMLIPRIKPLYYIYESEMILYAYYGQIDHISTECPYVLDAPMIRVKQFLENVENRRHSTMLNMVSRFQQELKPIVFASIPPYKLQDNKCEDCGMPTFLNRCAFCKMKVHVLEDLQKWRDRTDLSDKTLLKE